MVREPHRNEMAFLIQLNIYWKQAIFYLFVVPSISAKNSHTIILDSEAMKIMAGY